jgi:hypothetical protein
MKRRIPGLHREGHSPQVRISHTTLNGRSFLNLGGVAPASKWEELSLSLTSNQEVAREL